MTMGRNVKKSDLYVTKTLNQSEYEFDSDSALYDSDNDILEPMNDLIYDKLVKKNTEKKLKNNKRKK